ncbi:MAG: hypothetical protein AABX13_02345 [Nanoarchaeota archaeon]
MVECQEPRCNRPATTKWGGRHVCQDHYEEYKEQQEKNIAEMRWNY